MREREYQGRPGLLCCFQKAQLLGLEKRGGLEPVCCSMHKTQAMRDSHIELA